MRLTLTPAEALELADAPAFRDALKYTDPSRITTHGLIDHLRPSEMTRVALAVQSLGWTVDVEVRE